MEATVTVQVALNRSLLNDSNYVANVSSVVDMEQPPGHLISDYIEMAYLIVVLMNLFIGKLYLNTVFNKRKGCDPFHEIGNDRTILVDNNHSSGE